MATLKELKLRISSVKSTQKITKAKQMVAAAKLRRAQAAAEAARPYAERLEGVVSSLATKVGGSSTAPRLLAGSGRDQVHLLVVMAADRGLAGAFNANIVKAARNHAEALLAEGKTVKMLLVGRKARSGLIRQYGKQVIDYYDTSGFRSIGFVQADEIAGRVFALYEAGDFDVATLFYSKFRTALLQEPTAQQIIPVPVPADAGVTNSGAVVEYEPDEEAILADLLPRNIKIQIFKGLLENVAGEQGASMTAMDNATRNAGDLIKKLTIEYNRSRQAAITKELIEIISGAEAL
ncbi:F0F1 ATP synthase subunit gamma [Sandaracinobacter neustonicus]|uniref:ATP synthase gamma chain n=1 Tax=Sandaracinobacter neustonicus TaxID=1715348 RepID=A0A501XSJ7_9SPHN|nr:F0F1 ATP synthase subunit gamma [Sandaracinobacter neustonicus]TPE63641.1 F0F1 ATP synthase subunit gamma [Sandaracinobacter neustonicus]